MGVGTKCRFFCSNKWWEAPDRKGVAKNFGVRFTWALFNVLKTLKSYTVVLALILGILLVVFSAWLVRVSDQQERKMRQPLLDTDAFIDDVVLSLNFMTQEAPNIALEWINGTIRDIGETGVSTLSSVSEFIEKSINRLSSGTESSVNRVAEWGASQVGASFNPASFGSVNIPAIALHPNWAPLIPNLDLSEIRIPERGFSVDDEIYPFVRKVYDIPRVTAYYASIIGIILLTYAGVRLFLALISAFIPRPDFMWCCGVSCGRVTAATGGGIKNAGNELAKPWIHVPITIGICIVLLVVLFLTPGINTLSEEIRVPLREADKATAAFIGLINVYLEKVPEEVVSFLNSNLGRVTDSIVEELGIVLDVEIFGFANSILNGINIAVEELCLELGFDFYPEIITFSVGVDTLNLPSQFIPPIPPVPTDEILIPLDLVAIERPISPWVDDRMDELHGIANTILWVGIWLIILPGIVIAWAFSKAFVPRKLNEFIDHPDFFEDKPAPEEQPHTQTQTQTPVTKSAPPPLPRRSQAVDLEISEPRLVQ